MNAEFFWNDINAPKPNRPNHIGTTAIIEHNGKILFEKRKDNGSWALVGGGLKNDESFTDGIIREISEETGILIDKSNLIPFKIYDDPLRIAKYPDGNILRVITVVFIVNLLQSPNLICSEESLDLKFFSKNQITELDIAKTHIQIVDDFLNTSGVKNNGFKIT